MPPSKAISWVLQERCSRPHGTISQSSGTLRWILMMTIRGMYPAVHCNSRKIVLNRRHNYKNCFVIDNDNSQAPCQSCKPAPNIPRFEIYDCQRRSLTEYNASRALFGARNIWGMSVLIRTTNHFHGFVNSWGLKYSVCHSGNMLALLCFFDADSAILHYSAVRILSGEAIVSSCKSGKQWIF